MLLTKSIFSCPDEIKKFKFDIYRSIGGLVVDKRNGNLLKLSRYSKVKKSFHGLNEIDYKTQNSIYREMAIDINSPDFKSLDTAFAISNGVLFSQLVDLKKKGVKLPDYSRLSDDVDNALDEVHQNRREQPTDPCGNVEILENLNQCRVRLQADRIHEDIHRARNRNARAPTAKVASCVLQRHRARRAVGITAVAIGADRAVDRAGAGGAQQPVATDGASRRR